jgi:hypothetical protein
MNKFIQFFAILFVGSFSMYIFSSIANFFGIGFQYYGVYLLFATALGLLFFILPRKHANIFV